jgi:hypothetical protein
MLTVIPSILGVLVATWWGRSHEWQQVLGGGGNIVVGGLVLHSSTIVATRHTTPLRDLTVEFA